MATPCYLTLPREVGSHLSPNKGTRYREYVTARNSKETVKGLSSAVALAPGIQDGRGKEVGRKNNVLGSDCFILSCKGGDVPGHFIMLPQGWKDIVMQEAVLFSPNIARCDEKREKREESSEPTNGWEKSSEPGASPGPCASHPTRYLGTSVGVGVKPAGLRVSSIRPRSCDFIVIFPTPPAPAPRTKPQRRN